MQAFETQRLPVAPKDVAPLDAGVCLTIPLGTCFQFRSFSGEPLVFVVATMQPWPGMDEGRRVTGRWDPDG